MRSRSASRRCRPEPASRPGTTPCRCCRRPPAHPAPERHRSPRPPSSTAPTTHSTSSSTACATPVTIASGTYDAAGLLGAVNTALAAAGGGATAALDATGRLRLTSTHEGSAASLQVMGGGSANAALGLTDFSAATGTDGTIQIGTEPAVTVTSAGTGATVSVDAGAGNIDVKLDGGLRVGDAKVVVVSTGDRSLASVAAAINGANAGANAAAIKVADGAWILQLSSSRSGTDNAMALDATVFGGVGGLLQTSGAAGRPDHDRHRSRCLFGRRVGQHVHRRAERSDAHSHRRVGDPCDRQRRPRRRAPPLTASGNSSPPPTACWPTSSCNRATTRRPRRLRR